VEVYLDLTVVFKTDDKYRPLSTSNLVFDACERRSSNFLEATMIKTLRCTDSGVFIVCKKFWYVAIRNYNELNVYD
jgi:hypothetical protein